MSKYTGARDGKKFLGIADIENISPTDASKLASLYLKWIGSGDPDLAQLQASIQRELTAAEKGRIKCSPGLITEMRSERNYVSRIVNAHNRKIA